MHVSWWNKQFDGTLQYKCSFAKLMSWSWGLGSRRTVGQDCHRRIRPDGCLFILPWRCNFGKPDVRAMIWGIRRRLATVFKQDSIQKNGAIVSRFFKGGMITLRVDTESANLTMMMMMMMMMLSTNCFDKMKLWVPFRVHFSTAEPTAGGCEPFHLRHHTGSAL